MSILSRLFGSKKKKARIIMGLTHKPHQLKAVKTALQEFIDEHSTKISGKPELTFTSEGSIIEITVTVSDQSKAMTLNDDLRHRLMSYGIEWR